MIRKFAIALGVTLSVGTAAHFISLNALPWFIMDKARKTLRVSFAVPENQWVMVPRPGPEARVIVRPSPDLAYMICMLDLSKGPVRLTAPQWDAYGSLSIFQRNTVNVFNASLRGTGADIDVIAVYGDEPVPNAEGATVVRLNSREGIALVRRLAPTQPRYDAAAALAVTSQCRALGADQA